MAAVRSGDLDVLAYVQSECSSASGKAEFRKMMSRTAAQIRESSKTNRPRNTVATSSSSTSLRQAGAAVALTRKPSLV